jgi:hypothetical protein
MADFLAGAAALAAIITGLTKALIWIARQK